MHIPPDIASLEDYAAYARERMGEGAWAYVSGGGADEITLARNRAAFDRLCLNGRVLAGMTDAHTRLDLLGHALEHPILLAPVANQRLAHPEGEAASALAAMAAKTVLVASTEASLPLEEVAQAGQGASQWFQLYIQHDRGFTRELVARAEAAGFRALVVTVDAAVNGVRNREQRAGFRLPPGLEPANLLGMRAAPGSRAGPGESPVFRGMLDGAPTWEDIGWLRSLTRLPVILKGIMSEDDAALALEHGADGIVVSNHGGRTLDTLPAAIEALPRIAARVEGRVPILMDGGIRRGTDVLKALALGAKAVLIGRPYVWALAVGGPSGIIHALTILRAELEVAMALTGCRTLEDIGPGVLWRGKPSFP